MRAQRRSDRGFTLVEMLAVVGIMVLLMALSVPAINGLTGSAGRKGAIRVMLNAFERARVVALESSTNAYIGFADQNFPKDKLRYRAFIIFRDRIDTDSPAAGEPGATQYVALSKWEELPGKISFLYQPNSLISDTNGAFLVTAADNNFAPYPDGESFPALQFTSTGSVSQANNSPMLGVYMFQGFHVNRQPNFTSPDRTYFDQIEISRFTGRARLIVTSTL